MPPRTSCALTWVPTYCGNSLEGAVAATAGQPLSRLPFQPLDMESSRCLCQGIWIPLTGPKQATDLVCGQVCPMSCFPRPLAQPPEGSTLCNGAFCHCSWLHHVLKAPRHFLSQVFCLQDFNHILPHRKQKVLLLDPPKY